ncbi:toxic anion resistance protein [Mesobacillus selenatarsenatis]|uniref:Toxic anion resistance protein TelA n=1 Tax=Mesobacillus selenatarsenatis (strain DSM 18680 / JCM 14380 / FERM P-15431 / SF-1) TaxID=1321606 RepID=A0A0A8X8D1_MESS1|nr:toxic anion resistance protein [Mesobacillus selenatarsenatis]GAM15292.1 toxic anion resistance protein TelA [Mesobacillus selenatarsenatis SF-1]
MNPTHDQNISSSIDRSSGEAPVSDIKLALRNEHEVQELARSIDEKNSIDILEYGKEPAVAISRYSDQILDIMRTSNLEDLLKQLGKVMNRFDKKDFQKATGGILSKLFKKNGKMMDRLYRKYQSMGKEIEQVYIKISEYKCEMTETATMLERMYEQNHQYYLTLEKYVVAAELKLNELKSNKLPKLEQNALKGNQLSSIELVSLRNAIELLEQRIYDLSIAKMVSMQTAPQIKLLQRGNEKLIGKINSAFVTTIPIFKNGLIQAIAAKRQKLVADSMKELDRRTNEVLIKNAKDIAAQSVDIARHSGVPGIKIETLEECFHIILKGMKETKTIEEENKRLRKEGQQRLNQLMENYNNSNQQ